MEIDNKKKDDIENEKNIIKNEILKSFNVDKVQNDMKEAYTNDKNKILILTIKINENTKLYEKDILKCECRDYDDHNEKNCCDLMSLIEDTIRNKMDKNIFDITMEFVGTHRNQGEGLAEWDIYMNFEL